MKVKINDGYQGPPNEDGEPSQPGDTVEVDDAEGATLVASGIAEEVGAKARTAKNKSVDVKEDE